MVSSRHSGVAGGKPRRTLKPLVVSLLLASCSHPGGREEKALLNDLSLVEDLRLIQDKRIYFGHQSVGGNIIEGIRDLASATNGARLNLASFAESALPPGGVFAESPVGINCQPNTKCEAFSRNVARLVSGSLDIALMKFCYVDFDRNTNVSQLFESYRKTLDSLKAAYPQVTFVHVTAPLTARPVLWKVLAKRILRRNDESDIANLKRSEFNTLLLRHYAGEPVFDLARVESTLPDGRRNTFEYQGKTGYQLCRDYTQDGGHLNELGRRMAARELVRTLARVIRAKGNRGPNSVFSVATKDPV